MTTLFSEKINFVLVRYKGITLLLGILYLLSLVPIGLFFKVDTSLKTWFLENDPDYSDYLKFQEEYGSDELVTVLVGFENTVFDSVNLLKLKKAENELLELPFVEKVLSLTSAEYYRSYGNGLKATPVINDLSDSRNTIKKKLNKTPLGALQFIPKDEQSTIMYVLLKNVDELEKDRDGLTNHLRRVLSNHFEKYHIGGMAIINEVVNKMVMEESAYFSIYTSFFIFLILWLYFREMGYVLVVMAAVTLPVTFLFAVFFMTGYQLNTIATVIPTILMVYAVADGVHIVNNFLFYHSEKTNADKKQIIAASLLYSLKPCFYTSLTTVVSYLAFSISDLKVLREMGLFAAFGIMLAFFLAFIILGCGLMWIKQRSEKNIRKPIFSFSKNMWFRFVQQFSSPLIISGIGVVLLSIPMIGKITVGDNFMDYMKDGSIVKEDIYAIEKINGGFLPFEFLIKSTDSISMVNREKIKFVGDFQRKIVDDSLLQSPFSLTDLIIKAKNNEPENILLRIKLDDEKELKELLLENRNKPKSELSAIMNSDLSEIRITGKSNIYGSHQYREKIQSAKNIFQEL